MHIHGQPQGEESNQLKISVNKMQGFKGQRIQEIKLETEENSREGNNGKKKRREQRHIGE